LKNINKNCIIDNLLIFNNSYIQHKIDKIDISKENMAGELVVKINTGVNDLFRIAPEVYKQLNNKGLNISPKNYKTLTSKNFLWNYMLKILPDNIENPPFFRKYVEEVKKNLDFILENYYSNIKENIQKNKLSENKIEYSIVWFNPNKQKEYSELDGSFWLLKYINIKQYLYEYIIKNNVTEWAIKEIVLKIDLEQELTWFYKDRVKNNVKYELYVNQEKIFEETN